MSPSMLGGLAAIGAVIVVALLLRGRGSADPMVTPPRQEPEPPPEPEVPEGSVEPVEHDVPEGEDHVVAVTSNGSALVPHGHVVHLLPPPDPGEEWKEGAGIKSARVRAERALGMTWSAGDLRGARIVRGGEGEGEGAWVLEALGRDGEFLPLDFETRDAAEAALGLFTDHGILELGEDEDGNPAPPSREQFDEARRLYNETIADLNADDGEEPR